MLGDGQIFSATNLWWCRPFFHCENFLSRAQESIDSTCYPNTQEVHLKNKNKKKKTIVRCFCCKRPVERQSPKKKERNTDTYIL